MKGRSGLKRARQQAAGNFSPLRNFGYIFDALVFSAQKDRYLRFVVGRMQIMDGMSRRKNLGSPGFFTGQPDFLTGLSDSGTRHFGPKT